MSSFENTIQPAGIVDPVCSCGNEVGQLQQEIEFDLIKESNYGRIGTDGTTLSKILDKRGIMRMCCRKTLMIYPIDRLLQSGPTLKVFNFKRNTFITSVAQHLTVNPDL